MFKMLVNFINIINKIFLIYLILVCILKVVTVNGQQFVGESCTVERTQSSGICKLVQNCPSVIDDIMKRRRHTRCGFEGRQEIVCCPIPKPTTTTTTPRPIDENSRISERKCNEYKNAVYKYINSITLTADAEQKQIRVDKCGHNVVPLIVGGEFAKPREFPHMALIGYSREENQIRWACGGSLISDEYVLTAAHCLYSQVYGEPKYVRLGELDILSNTDDAEPEDFDVIKIIPHPEYRRSSKYNDLALLRLDRKVNLNPYKRPACLPTDFDDVRRRSIATGWGDTKSGGQSSSHLQKVTLEKFTLDECNQTYASVINRRLRDGIRPTQICAGSKNASKDTCQGDSGGPLQVFHPSIYCMYTLVGVTSFGIDCGNIGVPGVYTRIYPYIDWIENVVWNQK